jgi:electron transfer flavoprotein alpha subunit
MAICGRLLVVVHLPGGLADETARGLLSYGGRLAGALGAALEAVAVVAAGQEREDHMGQKDDPGLVDHQLFGSYGVATLHTVDAGTLPDDPGALGALLAQLVSRERGELMLLPHNDLGSRLAPVLSCALDAALLTEVVSAVPGAEGVSLSRQAIGERLAETRVWGGARPLVITVPTRLLTPVLLATVRPTRPAVQSFPLPAGPQPVQRVMRRVPPDPQTVDLSEAEVIISAGKGCDAATFELLGQLSRLLQVSFGVTRPLFDQGWSGFDRMVGQTGRSVAPRLYLAFGISGSMHHVGGIKDARRIVAVNLDGKAPIFGNADEGFVADLKEVVPLLVQRAAAAGGAA